MRYELYVGYFNLRAAIYRTAPMPWLDSQYNRAAAKETRLSRQVAGDQYDVDAYDRAADHAACISSVIRTRVQNERAGA